MDKKRMNYGIGNLPYNWGHTVLLEIAKNKIVNKRPYIELNLVSHLFSSDEKWLVISKTMVIVQLNGY